MFQRCSLLFMAAVMVVSQVSQAHFPEYCAECEQEVWEQVPCSEVPTTAAPPTTPRTTLGTTARPPTTQRPSTTTALPTTTSAPNIPTTEPTSAYKKCYCECKLGCKEFCRKVVDSNPKQPLTQISSIGEYVSGGQVEFTHVHQRKYFPKYAGEGYTGSVGGPKAYKPPYPLVYEREGAEASPASIPSVATSVASSSPSVASIAAPNYTLEELAQLLSSAYGSKKSYPSVPSSPQLQPAPPSPSVYYSPVYRQGPVEPILSKVLPAPKRTSSIKFAAAAVAASNGVSVAKIKTPYEEKVVVATPSTIYDRTTSYPIVEEVQKVYSAPQTESYSSQTEAYPSVTPIYPSPTESYPSHKESYPSITESYPSQTESYPSITESYQSPQPQAKSYGSLESGADKPSSNFDLAIDNYLKDFGYGNQGRGYGDY
ncbi:uncharacterized protein [Drosophila kikkawai]|uniref:Adhesive plaque matrix protein n=1 Tax=Drosophila kikkawai TaxID=30033 RepID=A0A6P4IBA1_DROKI|nr:adhesive plaque matrix protein [Drosophila kikkawai]XP_041631787.1 adhesive plaque matrix protein [Drosophila kikkawai]